MKKRCFVICPIGPKDSEIRKRSDQILKYLINPVAKNCGYDVIRGDEIDSPGMITSQVIQHLLEDELTIADLTGRNPNVFYELALRHAIGKPVIHIKEYNEVIPFDVLGIRVIDINSAYIDDIKQAKKIIKDYIKTIESEPNKIEENPITISRNSITISSVVNDLKNIQPQLDTNNKSLSNDLTNYYNKKIEEAVQELSNLGNLKEKAASIKILWVDDYPYNNKTIMDIYKTIGVQFDIAIDNEYAFELLEKKKDKDKYNLVISDMGRQSQSMAGISLIKNINKMSNNPKPPIVLYASQKAIDMYGSLARAEGAILATSSARELIMMINQIIES